MAVIPVGTFVNLNAEFPNDRRWIGKVVSHAVVGDQLHVICEVSAMEQKCCGLTSAIQIANIDAVDIVSGV